MRSKNCINAFVGLVPGSLMSLIEEMNFAHRTLHPFVCCALGIATLATIPVCAGVPIVQQAYFKASNTGPGDKFGWSMARSGSTVIIGAYEEGSSATGINGNQNDNGAPQSGAAYVFVYTGTNWVQEAYLKASNSGGGDWFGYTVAISGDTIVVGAPFEASSANGVNGDETDNSVWAAGAAYVFTRSGTNWTQQAYLKASNSGGGDYFGTAVAISDDTIVVGSWGEASSASGVDGNQADNSAPVAGAGYVFVRDGTTWSQQAYLKASNPAADDSFGFSVALSGDTAVFGAQGEASDADGVNGNQSDNSAQLAGAAYVFIRNGTTWIQQAYLKASNSGAGDEFGIATAISGDTLVVGAWQEDSAATGVNGNEASNTAPNSGAAYVFLREGTNWIQQAYLKASNTGAGDALGLAVGLAGDTVAVGAGLYHPLTTAGGGEDSSATGVNGNQSDNGAPDSGAAYVFVRQATNWTQAAYLKASNTGAGDYFGRSILVERDMVFVGAPGEDSNATGINGSENNNSTLNSGALYSFTGFNHPQLSIRESNGDYFVGFKGVPYTTYRLERAPGLSGPWQVVDEKTAPASGWMECEEQNPPPDQAWYRTRHP